MIKTSVITIYDDNRYEADIMGEKEFGICKIDVLSNKIIIEKKNASTLVLEQLDNNIMKVNFSDEEGTKGQMVLKRK